MNQLEKIRPQTPKGRPLSMSCHAFVENIGATVNLSSEKALECQCVQHIGLALNFDSFILLENKVLHVAWHTH